MTDILGGSNVQAPNLQPVDLSPGMESQGSEIAGQFTNRGLGASTNLTQAEAGNVLNWSTRQEEMNNRLAQQNFANQIQAYQANTSNLSDLASLAGFLGL